MGFMTRLPFFCLSSPVAIWVLDLSHHTLRIKSFVVLCKPKERRNVFTFLWRRLLSSHSIRQDLPQNLFLLCTTLSHHYVTRTRPLTIATTTIILSLEKSCYGWEMVEKPILVKTIRIKLREICMGIQWKLKVLLGYTIFFCRQRIKTLHFHMLTDFL